MTKTSAILIFLIISGAVLVLGGRERPVIIHQETVATSTIYFTSLHKLEWTQEWKDMVNSIFYNQDCKFLETGFRCQIKRDKGEAW